MADAGKPWTTARSDQYSSDSEEEDERETEPTQKNVHYGVDRIVAITDDGRGFVWHELNDCGEKAYDGTVVGEECPPAPAN